MEKRWFECGRTTHVNTPARVMTATTWKLPARHGFATVTFAGRGWPVTAPAADPPAARQYQSRLRGARFTGAALFEFSRWWLLDVCQVMLVLAVNTFADQEMGLSGQHVFTTLSRIAAIFYVAGSFRQLVRRFQTELDLRDSYVIRGLRVSIADSLSLVALIVVAFALTFYLDRIVFAFGGMIG